MSEQKIEELDLDELIIALEHSATNMGVVDAESLEYKAAQKLRQLQEAFEDGFELAQIASYAEITGGISVNRSGIRKFCDKIYAHIQIINP